MGAKTAANVKEKLTCDECKKEFHTVQALKTHIKSHLDKNKQMQTTVTESKDEKKTAFVPPTSRVSKRLQQQRNKSIDKIGNDGDDNSNSPRRKTVFECPLCLKVYQAYFHAQKHLQNRHAEEIDPISSNSLDTFKPIVKEVCTICSKQTHEGKHTCGDFSAHIAESYVNGLYCCLGCKRHFLSVAAFDSHVDGNHSNEIDTMLFRTYNEFLLWKCNIESQLRVKYLTLSNTTQRQYYQCNYVSPKNSADITNLCPSVLVTRETANGIQVQYYKTHYEHSCEYKMPEQFEKYLIKPYRKGNPFNSVDTDDDLYFKFKNLMKSIALGAAKMTPTNLKKLYNAALEMHTSFNNYVAEQKASSSELQSYISLDRSDSDSTDSIDTGGTATAGNTEKSEEVTKNKSMTDDQITQVLEVPKARASARLKRKSESSTSPSCKKQKHDSDKDANKKPGIKEGNYFTNDLKSPKISKAATINQSPSFNDSYKEFIGTTLQVNKINTLELSVPSPCPKKINKSDTVITPAHSKKTLTPASSKKINKEEVVTPASSKKIIKAEAVTPATYKQNNQEKAVSPASSKKIIKQEAMTHESFKKTVNKDVMVTPQSSKKINKKEIVKTKIGQFIPSPKKAAQLKEDSENVEKAVKKKIKSAVKSSRISIADVKLEDVEYEVLEQENDCNILVLKL